MISFRNKRTEGVLQKQQTENINSAYLAIINKQREVIRKNRQERIKQQLAAKNKVVEAEKPKDDNLSPLGQYLLALKNNKQKKDVSNVVPIHKEDNKVEKISPLGAYLLALNKNKK